MRSCSRRDALKAAGLAGAGLAGLGTAAGGPVAAQSDGTRVHTWICAQHEARDEAAEGFEDQTVRQVVHTSVGGDRLRLRFANVYEDTEIVLDRVTVAVSTGGAAVDTDTLTEVTVDGSSGVTIPAGERIESDPVSLSVGQDQDVAVSAYAPEATGAVSWHALGKDEAYTASGDATDSGGGGGAFSGTGDHYFFLDGLSVESSDATGTVVCLGDSIVDGEGSTIGPNNTFPDVLARRINASDVLQKSVVNAGLSGNKLLNDSPGGNTYGPAALDRLERDVFAQDGVTECITLLGTNDILHGYVYEEEPNPSAAEIAAGLETVATRCHENDVRAIACTIPGWLNFYPNEAAEEKRRAVNEWIREQDVFDATVDVAFALTNGDGAIFSQYDDDGLHPNDNGYETMAQIIDLRKLTEGWTGETTTAAPTSTAAPTATETATAAPTTTGGNGDDGGGGGPLPGFGVGTALAGLGAGAAGAAARRLRGGADGGVEAASRGDD